MLRPTDSSPITTQEQFRMALLRLRDRGELSQVHLAMLKTHWQSPNRTITATRLAEAVRLANYGEANLRYGTFAHSLAEALGYRPSQRPDGTYRWWQTLAYGGEGDETSNGDFEFVKRPELAAALEAMGWCKPSGRSGGDR